MEASLEAIAPPTSSLAGSTTQERIRRAWSIGCRQDMLHRQLPSRKEKAALEVALSGAMLTKHRAKRHESVV